MPIFYGTENSKKAPLAGHVNFTRPAAKPFAINVSWKSILLGTLYKFTNSGVPSPSRYATAPCIADTWEPMIAPLSEGDAPLR